MENNNLQQQQQNTYTVIFSGDDVVSKVDINGNDTNIINNTQNRKRKYTDIAYTQNLATLGKTPISHSS